METIITGLIEKVGLSEAQAAAVIAFLQANADKLPALLGSAGPASGLLGNLAGGLGGGAEAADADPGPAGAIGKLFG